METLFSTALAINGSLIAYKVRFLDEAYIFQPAGSNAPLIKLKREGEEWVSVDDLEKSIMTEAADHLERYLLSQH